MLTKPSIKVNADLLCAGLGQVTGHTVCLKLIKDMVESVAVSLVELIFISLNSRSYPGHVPAQDTKRFGRAPRTYVRYTFDQTEDTLHKTELESSKNHCN